MTTNNKLFRQEIELLQTYGKHKSFTHTTTGSSAETAVDIAANFEEANKVSFVVELGDAHIEFEVASGVTDGSTTNNATIIQGST